MPSRFVTCPETAHLEQIEYEDHPLGMVVVACSRFEPACSVDCERTCASRLDRKRRITGELDNDFEGPEEDTFVSAVRLVR